MTVKAAPLDQLSTFRQSRQHAYGRVTPGIFATKLQRILQSFKRLEPIRAGRGPSSLTLAWERRQLIRTSLQPAATAHWDHFEQIATGVEPRRIFAGVILRLAKL